MPKELYLSQNMEGLDKLCHIPDVVKQKPARIISKSIETMYKEWTKALADEDEELSYMYLMKYFNLIKLLYGAKDFKREEQYIRKMLGRNSELKARMDRLQAIQQSLEERYEKRNGNSMPTVTTNNVDTNKSPISDKMGAANANENAIESHKANVPQKSIECEELYRLMKDTSVSLLIMDCRSSDEFNSSHLIFKNILNVPEEIIRKGLSGGTLQQSLDRSSHSMWSSRCIMDRVILIDWRSKGDDISVDAPIWILRDILLHWDPDAKYENSIQIVNGGYEMFIYAYPMHTTNSKYRPKVVAESHGNVADIEYPELKDIKMKKDNLPFRPTIDRSDKLAAERKYNEKWKTASEIIKEKERLIDAGLEKEKKALELEADLEKSIREEEATADESKRLELKERQVQLQYRILQYNNYREDNITQRDLLEEVLGSVPAEEIPDSVELARVRQKEHEQKRLEMERRRKNEQNEKLRLEQELELKRLLKMREEELASKPKQPTIDRSAKPSLPAAIPLKEPRRDFEPVDGRVPAGLTGLRNLGNTCYMNSIIQCLSNVYGLCDYFLSDVYKKQLNKNNETCGEMTLEFAVVCKALWSGIYRSISPRDFRSKFGYYVKAFRGNDQQDSQEFLMRLIDILHSELEIPLENNTPFENMSRSQQEWHRFTKDKQSFVMNHFYGQTRSTVKCRECAHESAKYDSFSTLSLDLPKNGVIKLKDCMNSYFLGEDIDGWNCPKCKDKRRAIKKLDISILPPVLVIQLKRFEYHNTTLKKIGTLVKFPIDKLNISDYVTKSVKGPKEYKLCAVSNHLSESTGSGHYTAFCKNNNTQRWYTFDDSIVTPIEEENLISSAAYVLFYTSL